MYWILEFPLIAGVLHHQFHRFQCCGAAIGISAESFADWTGQELGLLVLLLDHHRKDHESTGHFRNLNWRYLPHTYIYIYYIYIRPI